MQLYKPNSKTIMSGIVKIDSSKKKLRIKQKENLYDIHDWIHNKWII